MGNQSNFYAREMSRLKHLAMFLTIVVQYFEINKSLASKIIDLIIINKIK